MPIDERIVNQTEIQKVTSRRYFRYNRYPDVNTNEVTFREKLLENMEYENIEKETKILITERTDITQLLGMEWMKKFRV